MPGYDPSLIVLAFEGEEAGRRLGQPGGRRRRGVGRRPRRARGLAAPRRRQGVARPSFAEFAARGHHEVRLGVDTENATGATDLYARDRHDGADGA